MRQVPILMYHWFREEGTASQSRSPQLEITPASFERQMVALEERGFRTVSLQQSLGDPAELPPKPIVLTFDDGTLDFWHHARPVLQRLGMTATLFVVSGYVGGESSWDAELGEPPRPLMDWDQLRTLSGEGFEIGSHTHRHRPLTTLDDDEAREELARSREMLTEKLGRAPELFAYPRGFYDERHPVLVREAGYAGACAVILGWGQLRGATSYELKRMTIKGTESMLRFRLRLLLARCVRYDARRR